MLKVRRALLSDVELIWICSALFQQQNTLLASIKEGHVVARTELGFSVS